MLDGKLGQVTFRIFSTLLFLNTATTDFSGQFQLLKLLAGPAEQKRGQLRFIPTNLANNISFSCSLKVLGIFQIWCINFLLNLNIKWLWRCSAGPDPQRREIDLRILYYILYFDLLFEVKQLGLNWTTRYILKFGLNSRFTALYVLCAKLLVSTKAQGISSLSVAQRYELTPLSKKFQPSSQFATNHMTDLKSSCSLVERWAWWG